MGKFKFTLGSQWIKWVPLLLCIFVITQTMIGCGVSESEQSAGQTQEKEQTLQPTLIDEWTGTGSKNTQSFTMSGSQWAISWTFNPKPPTYGVYANYFSIEVYKPGSSFPIELVANIANTTSGESDISYIHTSGSFYLAISSLEGNWAIKVYDYR